MKTLSYLVTIALFASLILICCNKQSNNYTIIDHTVGMLTLRQWSGAAFGNIYGDTTIPTPPTTTTIQWPKSYYRALTDTSFSIIKTNGFAIIVLGTALNFRSVDSVNKIVRFDSTYANSATSFLIWDFAKDTMHFEYHRIIGYNATADKYYEDNWVLHSDH